MPTLLRMPAVAADATHFVLVAWSVKENDAVQAGDSLAEIETDKAIVELEAEKSGKLARQLVAAGTEVPVGGPIAVLLHEGETDEQIEPFLASGGVEAADLSRLDRPAAAASIESETREKEASLVSASPVARRMAEVRGVDLASVRGSGPRGRVVKKDLEAVAATTRDSSAVGRGTAHTNPTGADADFSETPHRNMRKAIARRLSESKSTIPHFYVNSECRMDRLLALRAELNGVAPRKISVNDFVVRAVALALREVPGANVGWTDSAMRQYSNADIAVAVSTDGGLITPIVRRADSKALWEISEEIASLAERARSGQLRPDEYQGGSFSLSNLGMHGVSEFSAIINPPQAAILAIGTTQPTPAVVDGQVAIAQVMRCTLSVDHRAIDGALAAQWMAAFRRLIEAPLSLLV